MVFSPSVPSSLSTLKDRKERRGKGYQEVKKIDLQIRKPALCSKNFVFFFFLNLFGGVFRSLLHILSQKSLNLDCFNSKLCLMCSKTINEP